MTRHTSSHEAISGPPIEREQRVEINSYRCFSPKVEEIHTIWEELVLEKQHPIIS